MKRPLLTIGLAFFCATWTAFQLTAGDALLLSGALVLTAVLARLLRPDWRQVCLVLLTGALAMGCVTLYDMRYLAPFARAEGQEVEVHGLVLEVRALGRATDYTILADFPGRPDLPDGREVTLRNYSDSSFQAGDGMRCVAAVTTGKANKARGEALRGVIRGQAHHLDMEGTLRRQMLLLRERMQQTLYLHLSRENAGMVGAMVLGLRGEVPGETYLDFNRAGTSHLLSVSGLHLSILTAAVLGVLGRLRVPRTPRCLCAIVVSFLFAMLAGFNAPIARAFVMTLLALTAGMLSRRGDSASALGLALLLICLLRPHWVLGRGLWLSATSTLGILLFASRLQPNMRKLFLVEQRLLKKVATFFADALTVSLCAYALSFPVFLLTTGGLSLVSPVANLLAAPFVAPVVLGGAACALGLPGLPGLGWVATVTDLSLSMVAGISRFFAALPFAVLSLDEGYLLLLLGAALAGGCLLWYFRADRRLVSWALLLLVLGTSAGQLSLEVGRRDLVELAVIENCDVAVLLRGGDAVLLGTPTRYNINRLTGYLDFRGVTRVTAILASDCPERADSGLLRIRDRYGIDLVIGPDDAYILGMLEAALPDTHVLSGGYATVGLLGGVEAHPSPAGPELWLEVGGFTILKSGEEYGIIAKDRLLYGNSNGPPIGDGQLYHDRFAIHGIIAKDRLLYGNSNGPPIGDGQLYHDRFAIHGIMNRTSQNAIGIYPGGALALPPGVPVAREPVGRRLHGETRLLLRL